MRIGTQLRRLSTRGFISTSPATRDGPARIASPTSSAENSKPRDAPVSTTRWTNSGVDPKVAEFFLEGGVKQDFAAKLFQI